MESPSPVLPRRPLLQFSLRTLLIGVALLAAFFAWYARERRLGERERLIADMLHQNHCVVVLRSGQHLGQPDIALGHYRIPAAIHKPSWWERFRNRICGDRIESIIGREGLTNEQFAAIDSLSAVESLWLSSSLVSELTPLENLKTLEHLELRGCQVRDLAPLAHLPLESLTLSGNPVSDAAPLAGLATLRRLDLTGTQVTDVGPLAHLQVRWLALGRTPLRDLGPLAKLSTLESLSLTGTEV